MKKSQPNKSTAEMTSQEYNAYMAKKKKPKASKYNSVWVEYSGIRFQSGKERDRYMVLEVLLARGSIRNLRRQVSYELNPGGQFSYRYVSDFEYDMVDTGKHIVEDTKGFITREFKKKAKLMLKLHNIKISII